MVTVGPEGLTRERYAPVRDHAHCVFEHVYFSRPDSIVFGRPVQQSREMLGRLLVPVRPPPMPTSKSSRCPTPESPPPSDTPQESGLPYRQSPDPQATT